MQHMKFTENPTCVKCGYDKMVWSYTLYSRDDKYINLKCIRCSFECTMDCKDALTVEDVVSKIYDASKHSGGAGRD